MRATLQHHLGVARSAVRTSKKAGDDDAVAAARERVGIAKRGLGERGDPWWDLSTDDRRTRWDDAVAELDAREESG
ncbi:hypothetical protein [Pseudonocardia sediminis]|uniref:hypothetical protein n=1 Tax=Pseudonocardia sediminis TaxID=1397368 RepID=UPI001F5F880D|nr:hypothetical protein [Pseudonocardia sediminis]